MSLKVKAIRLAVFFGCLLIAGGCFTVIQSKSNPLSRYPYGTAEQREQLAASLDDEQINYLINTQILPEMVIPFMNVEGFVVSNTLYYDAAMRGRSAEPEFIVEFVNSNRERLDLDTLSDILSWLNYPDYLQYLDSGTSLPLAAHPNEMLTILNGSETVFTYKPENLAQASDGTVLVSEAASAWDELVNAAAQEDITLSALSGYVPYENQSTETDYRSYARGPYGTREEQLGYTVMIDGYQVWNETLSSSGHYEDSQYVKALQALSEEQLAAMDWLRDYAWQHGWIVRYPQNKEASTSVTWQPFILRYVCRDTAAAMHEGGYTLEEWTAMEKQS